MDTSSELYLQIADVLQKVQTNVSCHQKYGIVLQNLYKNSDVQAFYDCFERILKIIVTKNPRVRNIYVERAVDFCAFFCASVKSETKPSDNSTTESALCEKVINFLLDLHDLKNDTVRYRVCQMINKLLNNLTGTELSEDLGDKIEEAMLNRLHDDKSEIRFQAISAVYRLQDPSNSHCKIIPELILHMKGDPIGKVRRICVEKITIRREGLTTLVTRTRDVNTDVRLAAFLRIAKLVKQLKISERQTVIRNGFLDTCEPIRKFVATQLIPAWLNSYDNNYLKLLKAMRLDATERYLQRTTEVTEYVLHSLFRCKPCGELLEVLNINNDHVLAFQDLNWESSIYWRCLVEIFRKSDEYESHLNNILPDLVHFSKYICDYYKTKIISSDTDTLEFQFVLNQLFIITQGYDVSDTVTRQVLNELVADILRKVNLTPRVTNMVIKNLRKTIPNVEQQASFICEIISDIMYPMPDEEHIKAMENTNFQIAQLKVELNCLHEKLNQAVKEEDYESAIKYKMETSELQESINKLVDSMKVSRITKKTDIPTIVKCLDIARGLLVSEQITCLSPVLRTFSEDTIVEYLTHSGGEVRVKALGCYALCCVVDEKTAEKGIHIFSACILANTIGNENDSETLLIAIKAVVDLLVLYGQKILNPRDEDEFPTISVSQILQVLVDLMDDENPEIQECSGRGLCNLILNGTVCSSLLISRMILKWCNPASEGEENERLRQTIGMMLEELPKLTGSADMLEKAVLPTVKTLLKAPSTSPLADVNVLDVIKFILALCSICEEASNLHSHLAVLICFEIKDHPQRRSNVTLSRMLLMLDLPSGDEVNTTHLINICDEIKDVVDNRMVLNNIIKFIAYLDTLNMHDISVIKEENEE